MTREDIPTIPIGSDGLSRLLFPATPTHLSAQVSLEIFQVILVDLPIPMDSGLQWILGKSLLPSQMSVGIILNQNSVIPEEKLAFEDLL